MLEFKYDTQLLIEGTDLDEDEINDYITEHFKGDCLLAVGDEELIKIHFHTNEPWKILEYCNSVGEIFDIVVEDMIRYENSYPYVIGLVLRATKNITNVAVCHREREEGSSGYTLKKLLGLWFNGFTAFSVKPLRIATTLGVGCAGMGFLYGIYTIIKRLVNPNVPMGFSALMAAVVFFGGMIMIMLGLIGEYVGRIYISMNNSPQYVIREKIHLGEEDR